MTSAADDLLSRVDNTLLSLRRALESRSRLAIVTGALAVADVEVLDRFCLTAQADLRASMCLVTLLDSERQTLSGVAGLDRSVIGDSTDVGDSLCQYVVATGESLRVDDTLVFCASTPGFTKLGEDMHSYYGEPIFVSGEVIGAFCALDSKTRHWTEADRGRVRAWAETVERWFQETLAI